MSAQRVPPTRLSSRAPALADTSLHMIGSIRMQNIEKVTDNVQIAALCSLHLENIILSVYQVATITRKSNNLQELRLTDCLKGVLNMNLEASRCAFNAFARLLQTWKTPFRDANAQRWLDIHSTDIPLYLMDVLVYGLCMPDCEQPYDEYKGICYSCKDIILSANACNVNVWDTALTRVGSIALDIYPKVSLTLQAYTPNIQPSHPLESSDRLICRDAVCSPKFSVQSPVSTSFPPIISQPNIVISNRRVYSNATRERQRYMWQWEDYKCKACDVVWKKHSVTISWRQTTVSHCLRKSKQCVKNSFYVDMCNGVKWLTNNHVYGQGGNNLTPEPKLVLQSEAIDKLVSINPQTMLPEYSNI